MEQAFNHFNSGKYKEAFNQLNLSPTNTESYQPNLVICEHLANRSIQSSQVCLKKLSQLLAKKSKKDGDHYDRLTEQLLKYNLGILMMINGKKENAYALFSELHAHEKCFIDFLKYRMLLLLMELNVSLKASVRVLALADKYINQPYEQRNSSSQWISLVFHEHSKAYFILREELDFMVTIFASQAMMQLGVSDSFLPPDEDRETRREQLIDKARKRKNNINKYYEINLLMIDRFYQAQRQFHQNNCERAIELLHFSNIQAEFEQMPQTKIVTNIYSSLSNNNISIVNFSRGKKTVALHFLNKAQTLLGKGCTGVEDKDLQLFSNNYAHNGSKIAYNLGLVALSQKSAQAYSIFEVLKKSNQQKMHFKYWYRAGQAELEYYHQNYSRMTLEQKNNILESSLRSFSNSLLCLSKREVPDLSIKNALLRDEELETIVMRMNGETDVYRQNITLLICYISLCLQRYYRVIRHAKELLKTEKTTEIARLYALHYLVEAEIKTHHLKDAIKHAREAEKIAKTFRKQRLNTYYEGKGELINESADVESILCHQNIMLKAYQGQPQEAQSLLEKDKGRVKGKVNESTKQISRYLDSQLKRKDNKYS